MKIIKLKRAVTLILIFITVFWAAACTGSKESDTGEIKIELISPSEGEVVSLNHPDVEALISSQTENEVAKILWKNHVSWTMRCDSQFVFLNWSYEMGKQYTVTVATDESLLNVVQIIESNVQSAEIGCLLPNTDYYWQVVSGEARSEIGKFTTKRKPCFLEVEGVDNFRDIGGYKTEDGKTLRLGMIYRSARLEDATENGASVMTELLGIISEIDLRLEEEISVGFSFKDKGNYLNATFSGYKAIIPQSGIFDNRARESFRQIFELLSDEKNYPIVFHCSAGADRTGTLAYLISGVLGVSYFELAKDFELTSFSNQGNRWRDNIVETPFGYMFDGSGMMVDGRINVCFGQMHKLMLENYITEDGTLASAISNYLINECGVKKEQIESLKNIMLA
ncbi:MAG: tyrosine-protein phosphatase [Clostridia bacterium]|nr:tyrosine-protein phosphatase [Clostridia bacterium]